MASGKVALVTGGGRRRVGWHVAEALAKRDYNVAIQYRTSGVEAAETVRHLEGLGVQAAGFAADISDEKSVDKMVRDVKSRFGRIDVLVCTAAAWKSKPLEEVTADDVRGYLEVNTLGTFLCCQHVGIVMIDQPEGGSIITFGDWACAALRELCRLLSFQRRHSDFDADVRRRTRRPQFAHSGKLYFAGAGAAAC